MNDARERRRSDDDAVAMNPLEFGLPSLHAQGGLTRRASPRVSGRHSCSSLPIPSGRNARPNPTPLQRVMASAMFRQGLSTNLHSNWGGLPLGRPSRLARPMPILTQVLSTGESEVRPSGVVDDASSDCPDADLHAPRTRATISASSRSSTRCTSRATWTCLSWSLDGGLTPEQRDDARTVRDPRAGGPNGDERVDAHQGGREGRSVSRDVVLVIDADCIVTGSLRPIFRLAAADESAPRGMMVHSVTNVRFDEWESLFALQASVREDGTYVNSGAICVSTDHWPQLLRRWAQITRTLPRATTSRAVRKKPDLGSRPRRAQRSAHERAARLGARGAPARDDGVRAMATRAHPSLAGVGVDVGGCDSDVRPLLAWAEAVDVHRLEAARPGASPAPSRAMSRRRRSPNSSGSRNVSRGGSTPATPRGSRRPLVAARNAAYGAVRGAALGSLRSAARAGARTCFAGCGGERSPPWKRRQCPSPSRLHSDRAAPESGHRLIATDDSVDNDCTS